jgi:hypothetical protein
MHNQSQTKPEDSQSSGGAVTAFLTKRQYAQVRQVSTRTVEHWYAQGMPHLRIGTRKTLIEVGPADEWLRERFRVGKGIASYRPQPNATKPG